MKRLLPVLLAVAVALVACGDQPIESSEPEPITDSGNTDHPPQDDVTLDVCGPDDATGWGKAGGTITNHSTEPSDYLINVELLDGAGTRYADGLAVANAVTPAQQVEWEAPSFTAWRDGSTCRITEVNRYAS